MKAVLHQLEIQLQLCSGWVPQDELETPHCGTLAHGDCSWQLSGVGFAMVRSHSRTIQVFKHDVLCSGRCVLAV